MFDNLTARDFNTVKRILQKASVDDYPLILSLVGHVMTASEELNDEQQREIYAVVGRSLQTVLGIVNDIRHEKQRVIDILEKPYETEDEETPN
jgi:hypothetical protein